MVLPYAGWLTATGGENSLSVEPRKWNLDFALSKSFNLTERAKLSLDVSFVNFLNHVNLGAPDMTITDANNPSQGLCGFGCISSAQGLYQFAGARTGQVGARIDF